MSEWDEQKIAKLAAIDTLDAELQQCWELFHEIIEAVHKKSADVKAGLKQADAASRGTQFSVAQLFAQPNVKAEHIPPELERIQLQYQEEAKLLAQAQDKLTVSLRAERRIECNA